MSKRWPGGIISKTAPVPTGPFATGTAPGVWTLEQQAYWQKQGLWPIAGNVNPDAFIENLFQTWLYTGNGSTQTITNGIDLAGKGGLVWCKARSVAYENVLVDTIRGQGNLLKSDQTAGNTFRDGIIGGFSSTGFSVSTDANIATNASGQTFASWTFREQAKFFDIVTYTGNGSNRTIAHNLGSVPGMIIVKCTSTTGDWLVYHRALSTPQNKVLILNNTDPADTTATVWGGVAPTSTTFSVSDGSWNNNVNGRTYVAYLFAHDAGGFGAAGNENVISCGSFAGAGAGTSVTLGYEPQWVMIKNAQSASYGEWRIYDVMRGASETSSSRLQANESTAESSNDPLLTVTSTGFKVALEAAAGETFIYMAIRRGPMATPTLGTQVFSPAIYNGSDVSSGTVLNAGFPVDLYLTKWRNGDQRTTWVDRVRGDNPSLFPQLTQAEESYTNIWQKLDQQLGIRFQAGNHDTGALYSNLSLRRAPGFFDVVCYTGTVASAGGTQTVTHNLGVVPELMICKVRNTTGWWSVYSAALGNTKFMALQLVDSAYTDNANGRQWGNTTPTATQFTVGFDNAGSGNTFVGYLFASDPGVSKVGSYTGTGTTQAINCGFTTGARFVLIKRTDSTGDWFYWDSARGIVAGNDPYLLLNSTAAEVTNTDYVDTAATGFEISSTAPAAINANGGSFIFLAIA